MGIWEILTIVFGILSVFFGFYYKKAKETINELAVFFSLISEFLKDDKLTKEELQIIVDQFIKIINIFKKDKNVDKKEFEKSKNKIKMIKNK